MARASPLSYPHAPHSRPRQAARAARPRQPIGRWAPRPLLQKVFPEHLQSVFPLSGGDWAKTGGQGPCLSAACPWPEAGHSREGNGLCWAAGSGWTALWEEPEEEPLRPRFHHPCWEPCGRRPVLWHISSLGETQMCRWPGERGSNGASFPSRAALTGRRSGSVGGSPAGGREPALATAG